MSAAGKLGSELGPESELGLELGLKLGSKLNSDGVGDSNRNPQGAKLRAEVQQIVWNA